MTDQPDMDAEAVLALLSERRALLEGHFRLSSGLHSSRYLQCARALQHPADAEALGRALADQWRAAARAGSRSHEVDAVVSPAIGGIVIGHEVGRALGVRALFVERPSGAAEGMVLRRGFHLADGERVLLVEDVVTTGRSTLEAAAAVCAGGAEPRGVACIANRSAADRLGDLPLVALADLDIPTWEPAGCPLCRQNIPLDKPGSRPT